MSRLNKHEYKHDTEDKLNINYDDSEQDMVIIVIAIYITMKTNMKGVGTITVKMLMMT